jgi:xanthosine phosphorylase
MNELINEAKDIILSKIGGLKPTIGIVLGSGLGKVAESIEAPIKISYQDLPGFPTPSVKGHAGELIIGKISNVACICLKGRVHLYEGNKINSLKIMIRTLKALGVDKLFLTNAAGSLRMDYSPGSIVAVLDHINLTGTNPLIGHNEDDWGPRFPAMDNAWDKSLREKLLTNAKSAQIEIGTGVLAGLLGPTFETPAEIRMLKTLGADTVGMSMIAENIIANHCGLKCVGVSAITNYAAGMSSEVLSHEQTLQGAKLAEDKLSKLIVEFIGAHGL